MAQELIEEMCKRVCTPGSFLEVSVENIVALAEVIQWLVKKNEQLLEDLNAARSDMESAANVLRHGQEEALTILTRKD